MGAYDQGVAELGFTHVEAYDHVLGADPAVHQPWTGLYDVHTTFHKPMVLYGYLAAVPRRRTRGLGMITSESAGDQPDRTRASRLAPG